MNSGSTVVGCEEGQLGVYNTIVLRNFSGSFPSQAAIINAFHACFVLNLTTAMSVRHV